MYTVKNYQSIKQLKEDLKAGKRIEVYSPGPFPCPTNGPVALEGPHYPEPHKWYAEAELIDGLVVRVK